MIPRGRRALGIALAIALGVTLQAGCGGGAEDAPPSRTVQVERGTVNSAPNVLMVPTAAVIEQGDQAFVTVPSGGEPIRVPFQAGAVDGDVTEVKSGLVEGQPILLPPK